MTKLFFLYTTTFVSEIKIAFFEEMKKKILFQQNNETPFNCDLSNIQYLGFLSVKMKLPGNFQQKKKLPGNFKQHCRGISQPGKLLAHCCAAGSQLCSL
jgi:hypothetical protein